MKNYDLNACGVQEMNAVEMRQANGGSWLSDAAEWVWDHGFVETWHGITSVGLRIPLPW